MFDLEVLGARWEARKQFIGELRTVIAEPTEAEAETRSDTLGALLSCLHAFGDKQIGFFQDYFTANASDPAARHPLYSPDYAFDVTNNQIGHDIDVLVRAGCQRKLLRSLPSATTTDFTLYMADCIAWAALKPAIDTGLIESATALVYHEKSLAVRLIPYAPVALVGIPYGAGGTERDQAIIVHEVGHFVAARRRPQAPEDSCAPAGSTSRLAENRGVFSRRVNLGAEPARIELIRALSRWEDEIFADVYACIVGGPMTGFTLLAMLQRLPGTRWMEDDGKHPLPILRPRIYAATLHAMAQRMGSTWQGLLTDAATTLDQETDAWLDGALPSWFTFTPRGGAPIRIAKALELITETVHELVNGELALLCPHGDTPNLLWTQAPFKFDAADRVVDGDKIRTLNAPPPLTMAPPNGALYASLPGKSWPVGATGADWQWEKARDTRDTDAIARLEAAGWSPWWLAVLSAGFWTTEGPGAGNPQPPS